LHSSIGAGVFLIGSDGLMGGVLKPSRGGIGREGADGIFFACGVCCFDAVPMVFVCKMYVMLISKNLFIDILYHSYFAI
jgi:hypothetical protein